MHKLSVAIITFNEESCIEACLDSVASVADEIIVLDSFSSDKTVQLAKSKGAKVFQQKFAGYTEQKQDAVNLCGNDYILAVDADEQLSAALLASIQSIKTNGFKEAAYQVNRLSFVGNRAVKTCGWYPDKKIRLWDRKKGAWGGQNPHDKVVMQHGIQAKQLYGDLLHFTYPTVEDMIKQADKFARVAANELKHKNNFYLILKLAFSAPIRFLKSYFIKRGFIEGKLGWLICFHQTREVLLKYFLALKYKWS
jgi:glycosyltransferase involved in cell wall biosynthesis